MQEEKTQEEIRYARLEEMTRVQAVKREVFRQNIQNQAGERSQRAARKEVRLTSYAAPLLVAGLKDLLDLVLVGSLPGIGTLVTLCFNLLIFLLFILAERATVRPKSVFLIQAGGAVFFSTLAEGLAFGLNFLPIGLAVIVGIYMREKRYSLRQETRGITG